MNLIVQQTTIGLAVLFVAFGVADYSPNVPEFEAGHSAVRAILGGTGRYMGARGQVTSTRNADGSYMQVFTLLK